MSTAFVLDSSAMLALFERGPGWTDVVDVMLEALEADARLLLNMANWAEMLKMAGRTYDDYESAERAINSIKWLPIRIVGGNRDIERRAALLFRTARLSYAASQAAALAQHHDAELVTGDPEFRRIENELKIRWIARSNS